MICRQTVSQNNEKPAQQQMEIMFFLRNYVVTEKATTTHAIATHFLSTTAHSHYCG